MYLEERGYDSSSCEADVLHARLELRATLVQLFSAYCCILVFSVCAFVMM